MNETQTHFVASCPYCSTQLRIRLGFAGQQVQCKHCNETFVAKETDGPATASSGEVDPVRPLPPTSQAERVVVMCPSCQAALSIRSVYLGRPVRCKQCDQTFLTSDSAATMAASLGSRRDGDGNDTERAALQAEIDRLSSENQRLRDEQTTLSNGWERVSMEHERLEGELDRQKVETNRLREELDRTTTELEAIRNHLGEIAPAAVRPLFEQRASLIAEIDRLRHEIQVSSEEQSARDRTSGERDRQREEDLSFARAEVDRLTGLLEQDEAKLEAARTEQDRLVTDRERAEDEAAQLRAALEEREQAIRDEVNRLSDEAEEFRIEGDRLRTEGEGLRQALEHAEQDHREELSRRDEQLREVAHGREAVLAEGHQLRTEIEGLHRALEDAELSRRNEIGRLETEVAAAVEERRQFQERHEAAEQSEKHLRERNQELQEERDRLRSAPPTRASEDELQAARDEIESLNRKLDLSDRLQREMAGILGEWESEFVKFEGGSSRSWGSRTQGSRVSSWTISRARGAPSP